MPSDVRAALDENTIEGATPERAAAGIHSIRSSNPRHRSNASRRVKRASSIARAFARPENMSKTLDLITASSDASALGHYLMRFCNGRRISDPSPRNLNWQEGFFGMILRVQIATYHAPPAITQERSFFAARSAGEPPSGRANPVDLPAGGSADRGRVRSDGRRHQHPESTRRGDQRGVQQDQHHRGQFGVVG